jgi:hypothetical protein
MITFILVGLRYTPYVLLAAAIGEVGRISASLYVNAQLDGVVAGGIFSRIAFQGVNAKLPVFFIYFGGPLVNYFVGMACGGLEKEKITGLVNPFASLRHPFAVMNIRLALLSAAYNAWQFLAR